MTEMLQEFCVFENILIRGWVEVEGSFWQPVMAMEFKWGSQCLEIARTFFITTLSSI